MTTRGAIGVGIGDQWSGFEVGSDAYPSAMVPRLLRYLAVYPVGVLRNGLLTGNVTGLPIAFNTNARVGPRSEHSDEWSWIYLVDEKVDLLRVYGVRDGSAKLEQELPLAALGANPRQRFDREWLIAEPALSDGGIRPLFGYQWDSDLLGDGRDLIRTAVSLALKEYLQPSPAERVASEWGVEGWEHDGFSLYDDVVLFLPRIAIQKLGCLFLISAEGAVRGLSAGTWPRLLASNGQHDLGWRFADAVCSLPWRKVLRDEHGEEYWLEKTKSGIIIVVSSKGSKPLARSNGVDISVLWTFALLWVSL